MIIYYANYDKALPISEFHRKLRILFELGYFISDRWPDFGEEAWSDLLSSVHDEHNPAFADAVARYQTFTAAVGESHPGLLKDDVLDVDGVWGPETEKTIEARWCSAPDFLPLGEGLARWGFKDVSYWDDCEFSGVSDARASKAYDEAARMWNEVCDLGLHRVNSQGSANIYAHARRIDGRGSTLAWSYLPSARGAGSNRSTHLEQRYDTGENWAPKIDTFLRPTMCHELGHAIGLSHDNDPKAIMYFAMNGTQKPFASDIKEAVRRYGPPKQTPSDPTPTPPTGNIVIVDGSFVIEIDSQRYHFELRPKGEDHVHL